MWRSCDDDRWREPGYRWNNGGSERFPQIGLLYDLAMRVLHSVHEIIYLGFNADRPDPLIVNFSEEVGRWRTQTSHDFGLERCRTSKFSHLNDALSVSHSIQEINYLAVVWRSWRRDYCPFFLHVWWAFYWVLGGGRQGEEQGPRQLTDKIFVFRKEDSGSGHVFHSCRKTCCVLLRSVAFWREIYSCVNLQSMVARNWRPSDKLMLLFYIHIFF